MSRATRVATGASPQVVRVGAVVLAAIVLLLPPWAVYLALVLPAQQVTPNWDVVWVGFDLALSVLAAAALVALRRRSGWSPVLSGALAAALVCDAWFDVMTSTGEERMLAVSLALLVELPVAAVVAVVGVRREAAGAGLDGAAG
jgi:hypothetical protein